MIWLTLSVAILALILIRSLFNRGVKYPPGPYGLPIVGYYPFLHPTKFIAFQKIGRRYGDVFTLSMFYQKIVVLNSIQAVKTAFLDQAKCFSFRPPSSGLLCVNKKRGIVATDGPSWKEHRRFALRGLRDSGFSKTFSIQAAHLELEDLLEKLEQREGEPVPTYKYFSRMSGNVVSRIMFGHRLSDDDSETDELIYKMTCVFKGSNSVAKNIVPFFPFLRNVPFFNEIYNKGNERTRNIAEAISFMQERIRDHVSSVKESPEATNLTDALILHKIHLDSQTESHTFDEYSIAVDLFDLFAAGIDTTAVTISWGVLLMARYPDIQEKVRFEIHRQLDRTSLPKPSDRSKLNYTLAVIDEIYRFSSVTPLAVPHRAAWDTSICDRPIPKDTIVVPNIYGVHHDERVWQYPNSFNPRNFLDEKEQYKPSDHLIMFSLGKRACLGESLARMEVFVFFVGLMQRSRVSLFEEDMINIDELFTGKDGVVRHLADHKIIFDQASWN